MNRVWSQYFGRGVIETVSDFGRAGANPTHPELLDYLADKFVKEGWSTKKLQREILLSSTYRQSSAPREDVAKIDPDNKLLAVFPRQRLDAEQMKASGFLTHLAAPQQLDESVAALVETIAAMAPLALSGMKKHLNLIACGRQDREAIARDVQRSVESADLREGGLAWREKRVAVFKGC